jgi:RsiW-degrading membrane proteinase PrsW (M82 family)
MTTSAVGSDRLFPPVARRWAWAGVLVGGAIAYVVVVRVMLATENVNFFPSLLLIGAVTVPMAVLVFAELGGRSVAEPPWIIVTTAIAGGVIGTVTAGVLEYDALRELGALPMVFVGLIEESAKLIVPVLLYLALRPSDPRGGVIVGVASGMGFATLETMGYGFQALLSAHSITAVDDTLLLRALLSPACHIAWTGATVAMLWRIRSAPDHRAAVLGFAAVFAAAVALHATWDSSTSVGVHTAVALVGVAALLTLIHRSRTRRSG